jgi:hypothetical protein
MYEENKQKSSLINILGLGELDERALLTLESMLGKERVDSIRYEVQTMMTSGKMDEKSIADIAERFGVPEKIVQLIEKYYKSL